jgi:hypothetical protein
MREGTTEDFVLELAMVYSDQSEAYMVLEDLNLPPARRPGWIDTPLQFWRQVIDLLEKGILPSGEGVGALARVAAANYPGNVVFRATDAQFDRPRPPEIFMNYRRDETSAVAGRLRYRINARLGTLAFMDIDSIEPGMDFGAVIQEAITSSDIMLVLMGEQWAAAADSSGRRHIDHPHDYVRVELEAALQGEVHIIPVLVDDAEMPDPDDLPQSLMALVRFKAVRVRRDNFRQDADRLIEDIERYMSSLSSHSRTVRRPSRGGSEQNQKEPILSSARGVIFVSYSHSDEHWLERLQKHLKPLTQTGTIELWDDTQLQVGDEWREEIERAIKSCQVAVLLVSADFMASDFIYKDELPPLLRAAREKGVRIFPVIVSSSYYSSSTLGKFQAVNLPSKPLDMMTKGEQEFIFNELHSAIRNVLQS